MASLEDLLKLMGQGSQGFNNPYSQMMSGGPQNPPPPMPVIPMSSSYSDMAVPPMVQPPVEGGISADEPSAASLPPPQAGDGGGFYSSTSMNPEMLKMYKKILAQSDSSIQDQKNYLDRLKGYRSQIQNKPLDPNYTALMMASDAWNGTNFQPQYKAPINQDQKNALLQQADSGIQNQLGNISKEELASLKTQLGGLMQSEKYKEGAAGKVSEQDEKDRQNLMKALDTEKSSGRFTPIGKAQGNIFQAQRIQALLNQYQKDPNSMPLTGPASLSEVAIGLNSLLAANGGSEESRKSLIPSSVRGKYSTLEQFITNEPVGANMEAFVKNAQDTLQREQSTNQGQIDKYRDRIKNAWGLGRYAKRNPDEFNKLVDFYTAPAEGSASPQMEQPSNGAAAFSDPEKEKRYQAWKAKQK